MSSESDEKTLRYRRAQSVTRAEEITEKENKARKLQTDKPCHIPRDSLFSWSSEFKNFTGLINWAFLMLSISGVRLCLENFLKYGFRVNPIEWIIVLIGYNGLSDNYKFPSIILLSFLIVPAVAALLIEKGLSKELIPDKVGNILHLLNIVFVISLPVAVIQIKGGDDFTFIGISTVCNMYLVMFLKLWSYSQTNYWCRCAIKKRKFSNRQLRRQSLSAPNNCNELANAENEQSIDEDKGKSFGTKLASYPDNLHLGDLVYFLLAPTLCYELNFPRTTRIRKRFLLKRLLEVIVGINLMLALFQQWMIPSVTNAVETFSDMDVVKITERLLKLAVPNHLIWLCFFYLLFHSFLNLMGELLHFADRNFYSDWWNATNVEVFWRTWNMPVHSWAVRHVFIPLNERGYSKFVASICVFLISALFHEYLVSVPLQMFRVWAFLGMMAQPPLAMISRIAERKLGPRYGNMIVWSSLIIGQPLAIMMYYHDYALEHLAKT